MWAIIIYLIGWQPQHLWTLHAFPCCTILRCVAAVFIGPLFECSHFISPKVNARWIKASAHYVFGNAGVNFVKNCFHFQSFLHNPAFNSDGFRPPVISALASTSNRPACQIGHLRARCAAKPKSSRCRASHASPPR